MIWKNPAGRSAKNYSCFLTGEQKNALAEYTLEQGTGYEAVLNFRHTTSAAEKNTLTEIQEGELYLCLEYRIVKVRGREIYLTTKEFDILALLSANPKRVFTYEMITDLVWKEKASRRFQEVRSRELP